MGGRFSVVGFEVKVATEQAFKSGLWFLRADLANSQKKKGDFNSIISRNRILLTTGMILEADSSPRDSIKEFSLDFDLLRTP